MAEPRFGFGALLLSCAIGITIGGVYVGQRTRTDKLYQELTSIAEAIDVIQRVHVSPPEPQVLLEDAIAGMVYNLDEYSDYLDEETLRMLNEDTAATYVGIGIEVAPSPKGAAVVTVFPNSPAAHKHIVPGDIIQRIGDRALDGLPLDAIVSLIRGAEGTDVQLHLLRGEDELDVTLTRARVDMETVSSRMLQDNIAWVRIHSFSDNILNDTRDAIETLRANNGREFDGLVLDLRGNPGGLLVQAVDIADLFLDEGTILSVRGIEATIEETWTAKRSDTIYRGPLVVVVDHSSASASELLAGALQDHDRATIIGQTSFGKGSVQAVIPLRAGGALKLTTSHYLTPSGRCIHREGIKPDVVTYDSREEDANPHALPHDVEIDAILAEDDMREREQIGCTEPKQPPRGAVYHLDVATVNDAYRVFVDDREDAYISAAVSVLHGAKGTTAPPPAAERQAP